MGRILMTIHYKFICNMKKEKEHNTKYTLWHTAKWVGEGEAGDGIGRE